MSYRRKGNCYFGEFFFNFYSENVINKRVVVLLAAVAVCVKQITLCVICGM